MILTECAKCRQLITCYYEAGDAPTGAFERIKCDKCGANNFVERISVNGRTYSEEEFMSLNPVKIDAGFKTDGTD